MRNGDSMRMKLRHAAVLALVGWELAELQIIEHPVEGGLYEHFLGLRILWAFGGQ